jgi:hypothetical protein
MLRYDVKWLLEYYSDERAIDPGVPYALMGNIQRVERLPELFQLTRTTSIQPDLPFDETIARLVSFDSGAVCAQPCRYSDGIRSNYAMDGPGELRERLRDDYGPRLPPLNDSRLSNGIGTAIIVLDSAGRPYLPRRAPSPKALSRRLPLHRIRRHRLARTG